MRLPLLVVFVATWVASARGTKKFTPDEFFRVLQQNNKHVKPATLEVPSAVPGWMGEDDLNEPSPQINKALLRRQLGAHFDRKVMSVGEPTVTHKRRKAHLQRHFLSGLDLDDGKRLKLKPNIKRKLNKYLSCQVLSKWTLLSPKFFPRWIDEGRCEKKTCSIPPGMKCKPQTMDKKTLLYWRCDMVQKACSWVHVHYPVLTACKCSCHERSK